MCVLFYCLQYHEAKLKINFVFSKKKDDNDFKIVSKIKQSVYLLPFMRFGKKGKKSGDFDILILCCLI